MIAVACLAVLPRRGFFIPGRPPGGALFCGPKPTPTHSRVVTPRPVSVHPIYSRTRGMCGAPGAFFPAKWHPRLRARVVKRWLCRCDARVVKRQKTTHPGRVGRNPKFDPGRQAGWCRQDGFEGPGARQGVIRIQTVLGERCALTREESAENPCDRPRAVTYQANFPAPTRSSFSYCLPGAARMGRPGKTHPRLPHSVRKPGGPGCAPQGYPSNTACAAKLSCRSFHFPVFK